MYWRAFTLDESGDILDRFIAHEFKPLFKYIDVDKHISSKMKGRLDLEKKKERTRIETGEL